MLPLLSPVLLKNNVVSELASREWSRDGPNEREMTMPAIPSTVTVAVITTLTTLPLIEPVTTKHDQRMDWILTYCHKLWKKTIKQ